MDSIVLWDKIRFVTSLSNEVWLHCQLPIGIQGPAELEGPLFSHIFVPKSRFSQNVLKSLNNRLIYHLYDILRKQQKKFY